MEVIAIAGFSEPFSSLSHLLASAAFLVVGFMRYLKRRAEGLGTGAFLVFLFACVFLLAISGVFHLLEPGGTARAVLQRIDHASIFLLIAATFTPIHVYLFSGFMRWGILLFVWTMAICGISLKTIFFESTSEMLGLALYLSMGWVGIITAYSLWKSYGKQYALPIVYGALAYTFGAILEFLRIPVLIEGVVGPHELFHIAVIVGMGLYYRFIVSTDRVRIL